MKHLMEFQEKIHHHNERLVKDIRVAFETTMRNGIGSTFLREGVFTDLYYGALQHALHQVSFGYSTVQIDKNV